MSIQVALIDKSEIIQKMLSHCLHYFSSKVARFDSLEKCQAHFVDKKPDIIFVDGELKKGEKALILSVSEAFASPVVLLYRDGPANLDVASLKKIPNRVKKPLNPKAVRDIFTKLVPQVKESDIHPFLRFPETEEEKKQAIETASKTGDSPFAEAPKDSGVVGNIKEKTQTFFKHTLSGILPLEKIKTQGKSVPVTKRLSSEPSKSVLSQKLVMDKALQSKSSSSGSGSVSMQKLAVGNTLKPQPPASQRTEQDIDIPVIQEEITVKTSTKKLNKEDMNIDEDTKNDLAPMAIKSSLAGQTGTKTVQNLELSEKDILRVLNKYKDTMEFQELMEKVLSGYAQKTVANILQNDQVTDILQKPLTEFKESQKFGKMVEKQIAQYVQKHLPLIIKETVEREIKKIIEG